MATITGNDSANKFEGTLVADLLSGLGGNDTIDGRAGDDTISGGTGADKLEGAGGNDLINGDAGNDKIEGGTGNDTLNGGADNDKIVGGSGADLVRGDSGADILEGGTGNDRLNGGTGADTFAFEIADDRDIVVDYKDGVDHIDLTAFNFTNAADAKVHAIQSGTDVIFDFGSNDVLTIKNITLAALTDTDFIL